MTSLNMHPPREAGLYDPRFEHDACGVGMVARLDNQPTHEVVTRAITALENLEHRGATGADPCTGDGAGILMQMPDELFRAVAPFELPAAGAYGVLMCFLPAEDGPRGRLEKLLEHAVAQMDQRLLGWRDVPVSPEEAGRVAGACRPVIRQLFVGAAGPCENDQDAFERKLYVIRRITDLTAQEPGLYVVSSSSRTINYKGMLISYQLAPFYADLRDERTKSAMALVHSRFSTNTFPSWELAHPYRVICHNGEINTLMGNVNWMRARESELHSELFGDDLERILPVVAPGNSDSATFDNVLELLMLAGRSLPHAAMMMIPEAYRDRDDLPDYLKAFYAYHACLMEPWDGPASVAFTDGRVVGATLDRNGLRPGRWVETLDGYVVLGSESGLLDIPAENVKRLGRLQPGKLFLVDLERGRIVEDEELKREIATQHPYGEWYARNAVPFGDLPPSEQVTISEQPLHLRQRAFGYSQEDLRVLLTPMAIEGVEPIGSMGNDLSLAVLSDQAPPLFSYFKQLFAQVTNPPIDPIREEIVMSLATSLGNERNLFEETPEHAHKLLLEQPILLNRELETLRNVKHDVYKARTLDITWPVAEGEAGMEKAIERICREASEAIAERVNIIVLSDRRLGPERAPVPSLLAVAAVHHHLTLEGTRLRAGVILESGEPREVHHFATLIGYGTSAINPYLALETLDELVFEKRLVRTAANGRPELIGPEQAAQNYVKAIGKGLLKTISKMGISTIQSYRAAQIFEAVGLERELIDKHFTGTASRIGGVGVTELARESLERHARAYPVTHDRLLPVGGVYAWRRDGEHHIWNPETIALVQQAVRGANGDVAAALGGDEGAHSEVRSSDAYTRYREYAELVNDDAARQATLRGLLGFTPAAGGPVPLEVVEPASEIVKRFCTGAMSLGSISREAHETLAIAMNRLGGRSNTGEGGEDPVRFKPDANGDRRRSAIKQVASGRFGVTIHYLVNADELQIKMAQGAKPGEGGQLPGHKVDDYIGSIRHTTPGVGLISPPPHHDIYSIEDLKQLIYDLRCSNPEAQVSVKLVSEVGVGTVAAGRIQGQRRPRADLRPRRRHRRLTAVLDPGGRGAVGDRAGGDPADAAAQRPALADRRADRRAAEDRPRRRDRLDAGSRRDGLLDRPADRNRLHHDAGLPPEHVPGRDRHPGPRAAQALQGHPRARRQLLLLRGRGGARDPGLAGAALARRGDRPRGPAAGRRGDRPLEGAGRGPDPHPHPRRAARGGAPAARGSPARGALRRARLEPRERRPGRPRRASPGQHAAADPQSQPLRRGDPLQPHRPPPRSRRPPARHDHGRVRGVRRSELRRLAVPGRDLHAVGRRPGLRRQGPLRRRVRDPPPGGDGRALRRRAERDRRQHRAVRRDPRPGLLPGPRG